MMSPFHHVDRGGPRSGAAASGAAAPFFLLVLLLRRRRGSLTSPVPTSSAVSTKALAAGEW